MDNLQKGAYAYDQVDGQIMKDALAGGIGWGYFYKTLIDLGWAVAPIVLAAGVAASVASSVVGAAMFAASAEVDRDRRDC